MRHSVPLFLAVASVLLLPASASAQWSDNFDSYANGSGLHGQGGWVGWDNNPAADAFVTNAQARSVPHSAEIRPTSDIVQLFNGVNSAKWIISGWVYVPSGATGQQFWILLNTYNHGGPYNWSLDLLFDMTNNEVRDFDNPGTPPVALIRDRWVEVRTEIDFQADIQTIFYDQAAYTQKSWTEGASGGGALNLNALDLFSNGGSTIYWDDLELRQQIGTPVEASTWGQVKASFAR